MMNINLNRDDLLKALQFINGVIEKKQTKAILANVLLQIIAGKLLFTATDTNIELVSSVELLQPADDTAITVPGRKLYDICRALPENTSLNMYYEPGERFIIKNDTSRFVLTTLPAMNFPVFKHEADQTQATEFFLPEAALYQLLRTTSFAMGQEDVRKYLNGASLVVTNNTIEVMAADSHRFALSTINNLTLPELKLKTLIPRKTALELLRLLNANSTAELHLSISPNYLKILGANFSFTSKLIYTTIPEYQKLIPQQYNTVVVTDRTAMQQALNRVAILSHEKLRSIIWELSNGKLTLITDNPEREEAEEVITVDYQGPTLKSYFNVSYLLDVLNAIEAEKINLLITNLDDGLIITPHSPTQLDNQIAILSTYIVMPLLVDYQAQ